MISDELMWTHYQMCPCCTLRAFMPCLSLLGFIVGWAELLTASLLWSLHGTHIHCPSLDWHLCLCHNQLPGFRQYLSCLSSNLRAHPIPSPGTPSNPLFQAWARAHNCTPAHQTSFHLRCFQLLGLTCSHILSYAPVILSISSLEQKKSTYSGLITKI